MRGPYLDLSIALGWTAVSAALTLWDSGGFVRAVFAIGTLLFIPGYVLTAALYPERFRVEADESEGDDEGKVRQGISGVERLALSMGLSVAVSPLLGLLMDRTPWGLATPALVLAVAGFVTLVTPVAYLRRARIHPDDRLSLHLPKAERASLAPAGATDRFLTIGLLGAIVGVGVLLAGLYASTGPDLDHTRLYLLDAQNGTSALPTLLTAGQEGHLTAVVENAEGRQMAYEVQVLLERFASTPNATVRTGAGALDRELIEDRDVLLQHGESTRVPVVFVPEDPGLYRLRVELYQRGAGAAQHNVHIWVKVQ